MNNPVSAQANIASHFSQRVEIFYYPNKVYETKYTVLRLDSPTHRLFPHNSNSATLAYHLIMNPSDYLESIVNLVQDEQFGVVLWQEPWLVLQRDYTSDTYKTEVMKKIDELREEWL